MAFHPDVQRFRINSSKWTAVFSSTARVTSVKNFSGAVSRNTSTPGPPNRFLTTFADEAHGSLVDVGVMPLPVQRDKSIRDPLQRGDQLLIGVLQFGRSFPDLSLELVASPLQGFFYPLSLGNVDANAENAIGSFGIPNGTNLL